MFRLPQLPFDLDAFEPVISAKTMDAHYNGHHRGYVQKLNELIKGTIYEGATLPDIVKYSAAMDREIYENACQHWLHSTYWKNFNPEYKTDPQGLVDEVAQDVIDRAMNLFGSGWIAVTNTGIITIPNTGPLPDGTKMLVDVWEHAYYLDYTYEREKAVRAYLSMSKELP